MVMCATVNAFDANEVHRDDIALGALPLFHVFGQTVIMNSHWRVGATLVLMPRFDAAQALPLMVAENVNTFHGVPTMYHAFIEAAATAEKLPALRLAISGGRRIAAARARAVRPDLRHPGARGLRPVGDLADRGGEPALVRTEAGTVGHPVWGVDVEIADPAERDRIVLLPSGSVGEVVMRGHNVFTAYTGRPEATADAVIDGWFRTGDLGTIDADGYRSIVDRIKEMIIRGGFNVYPTEVEAALLRHPNIAQVAIIGVPDEQYGEEILAVVVPFRPLDRRRGDRIRQGACGAVQISAPGGVRRRVAAGPHPQGAQTTVEGAVLMTDFADLNELKSAVGTEIGVSDWMTIDQQRVNIFADATDDHQWIHVDPERAKDGPFGVAIAHGYLTLSLAPVLLNKVIRVDNMKFGVNYGCNKVRFITPVPVGGRIRARVTLDSVRDIPGGIQADRTVTIELEGADKPACVAESIVRYIS